MDGRLPTRTPSLLEFDHGHWTPVHFITHVDAQRDSIDVRLLRHPYLLIIAPSRDRASSIDWDDSRVPKHVPASLSYKPPCAPVAWHSFCTGCCPPKGQVARSQGPNASNARNKKRDQKLRASLQVRVPGLPGSSYIRHLGTAPIQAQTGADPPRALPPNLHRGSADPARASTARSVLCTALPLLALPLLVTRESGTDAFSRVRVPRAALVLPTKAQHLLELQD